MQVELQEFLDLENKQRLEQLSLASLSENKKLSAVPANGRVISSYGMQYDKAYWRYEYPLANTFSTDEYENEHVKSKNSLSPKGNRSDVERKLDDDLNSALKKLEGGEKEETDNNNDVNSKTDAEKLLEEQLRSSISNIPVEKAGMRSTKQKSLENKEDTRICWRGKYYPKELVISDKKAREAMMIPRSSKLVIGQSLGNLSALSEVKYLQDGIMLQGVRPDELPIVVKEVASIGPGV